MAKVINTVQIQIDAAGAVRSAEKLEARYKSWGQEISDIKKQLKDTSQLSDEVVGQLTKRLKELEPLYKDVSNVLKEVILEQKNIDDVMADLSGSTYNELTRARTMIQRNLKSMRTDDAEYTQLLEDLRDVNEAIRQRTKAYSELSDAERELRKIQRDAVVNNPDRFSVEQLKEAIKLTQELRDAKAPSSAAYSYYQQEIEELQEVLDLNKKLSEEKERQEAESRRLNTIVNRDTASVDQLKEALKLTEQLRDAESRGSYHYEYYKSEAEELQKALEATKELSQAEQQRIEVQRQWVADNPIHASVEQLKEAIKQTEKLRDTQPIDSDEYTKYDKQLKDLKLTLEGVEKPAKKAALSTSDMKDALKHLDKQPLERLKQVAAQLEEELAKLTPNTKDYIRVSSNLRYVNGQIDNINESWKEHDGQILSTIKRLSAYVAVYGSYNFIAGKVKDMVKGWLQLSDTLADVEKTTGLAHKQLAMLSSDIDAIDTRTTQEQMHQLAATAGQIGLRSREEILGFVKAADQLTVALNELGDDGVQSLAKLAQLTGDVTRLGIEQSMLAIGSSINELSASSAATAGPIADFMRRLGGLANMANLSSADLAALGATADALGQPIEVAATAMNRFIMSLVTNTSEISYALNLDLQEMQKLIESGETMTAITKVLDALRVRGDEGALSGIFKELGSEGAKMQQTMMALAENVSFLKTQVYTSRDAFEEATSATKEYNVKNETAAAIVERIGNTVRDFFITAERAQWLTGPLNGILDFVKVLTGVSDAAAKARAAMLAFIMLIGTKNWWRAVAVSFRRISGAVSAQTVGVVGLRKAWIALKTAMSATNVISLALAAVSAAIVGITSKMAMAKKQAEQLAAALQELRDQEAGEKKALDELYNSITALNVGQDGRVELIEKFNSKYSSYLGYLVSETADVEELTRAYNLLNAEIKLRYAQTMKEAYMKAPLEEYGAEVQKIHTIMLKNTKEFSLVNKLSQKEILEGVGKVAYEMARNGKFSETEFVRIAQNIEEFAGRSEDTIKSLYAELVKGAGMGRTPIARLWLAEKELLEEEEKAVSQQKILVTNAELEMQAAREASMNGLKEEVNAYAKNTETIKAMKKSELEAIIDRGNTVLTYERNKANELIKIAQKTYEEETKELPTSDKQNAEQKKQEADAKAKLEAAIKEANAPVIAFQQSMQAIQDVYAGDAWGKALNIESLEQAYGHLQNLNSASVRNLVDTYDSLEKAGRNFTDVNWFNEKFGMNAKTIAEMHTFFKNYASQVKDQLKELGYTTAGNFDWSSEKGRSKKEKIKQEYQAALAALEAYYKEEETIIRKNGMANNLSETEIDHQLLENQEQFLKDRQELRKRMLAEDNSFDPSIYIGKITGTDYFKDKDLDLLARQMKVWGQAMTDGIRLGLVEDMNAVEMQAWKVKQKVLEIVNDRAWHEQVDREMMSSFESIEAFWGAEVEHTEENGKRILDAMKEAAGQMYTLDAEKFDEMLANNAVFGAMYKNLTKEQQQAFLILLGDYHDKVIDADKKFADERKRVVEQAWKDSGNQETFDLASEQLQSAQDSLDWYKNNDAIASRRNYFNTQQELLSAEVALQTWAHEQRMAIMAREGATQQMRMEEERNYMATMQVLGQQMLDNYKARYEQMASISTSYGEIIGDGLVRMAFDEENAGKELIKSLLKTTVEMASQFAQRLILQQTFGAAMQSIKAQQSSQEIASAYATAMQEIGIEASKMAAIEAIAAGTITAQSMAQPDSIVTFGASGAVRAALIMGLVSAATAGALALIDNLFPGAATEAESAAATASAPKRKLTTGMLTYAEGKYPVLGNDGVVYDAEYAGSNMKTGVYRKPHFGIFAEKQPEMVIDGKTTQRLVLNYPEIYSGILELSRTGRMGMRTYATGNVLEIGEGYDAQAQQTHQQAQMEVMQQTLAATAAAVAALTRRLDQPIHAEMNYFGKGGVREAEQRGGRWAARNRVR